MQKGAGLNDRYDLPISTSSWEAAERFQEGVDRLLSQNFGPEESLQPVHRSRRRVRPGPRGSGLQLDAAD